MDEAASRGGTLMEIEKLIERLQNWDGIKPDREIDCAIDGAGQRRNEHGTVDQKG